MRIDTVIYLLCAFLLGMSYGMENPRKPVPEVRPVLKCPVVAGHEVVSTEDSASGQFCTYANSYGRATRKVRVQS